MFQISPFTSSHPMWLVPRRGCPPPPKMVGPSLSEPRFNRQKKTGRLSIAGFHTHPRRGQRRREGALQSEEDGEGTALVAAHPAPPRRWCRVRPQAPRLGDWSIEINRKEKRLAISTAIASAAVAEDAFVVEEFDETFAAEPKNREFVSALQRWGLDPKQKAMFFSTEFDDNVRLSDRSIGSLKMLTARMLNLYDILDSRMLFFTLAAIDYLNSRYGATVFDEYEDHTDGEVDGKEEVVEEQEEEATTEEAAQDEAEESETDNSS